MTDETPSTKPENLRQEQNTPGGTGTNGNQQQQECKEIPVRQSKEPPPECNKPKKSYWNEPKNWVSVLTLIFVGVYTVITVFIWCEMRKQTINAARAWVGLDKSIAIDAIDASDWSKTLAHYTIKNFGNGPAFNVAAWALFFSDADRFQKNAKQICAVTTAITMGTIPSPDKGPPPNSGYALFRDQPHDEVIGPAWTNLRPGKFEHFWFVGCVSYRDQFNNPHWTRFCEYSDPNSTTPTTGTRLYFCRTFNDTDETPTHK